MLMKIKDAITNALHSILSLFSKSAVESQVVSKVDTVIDSVVAKANAEIDAAASPDLGDLTKVLKTLDPNLESQIKDWMKATLADIATALKADIKTEISAI